ncbi:MAG TPA: questin oxidase family protein [Dehalococcoidia bacterium]|nr:questin oxidase family protein [Dehalococcoidia bacterium]
MNDRQLDEALTRFAARGPEFGPGLSNHGPMASEALAALGRHDAIEPWAEWYASARQLGDRPESRNPIQPDDWRAALGDIRRAGDWSRFFEREIASAPWHSVLQAWAPRLLPGIMAGATHGFLRTAHAVRALDAGETPERVRELGEGLAYWAARYQTLPTSSSLASDVSVAEAIARVPKIDPSARRPGLIFDAVRAVDEESFGPVIALVSPARDTDAFVDEITRNFVRLYLSNAQHASISFVHTVTAPSALRFVAPHLDPTTAREAKRYVWQACAAIYSAYARSPAADSALVDETPDEQDLVQQSIAARDEHAIKFTEACLREYRRSHDGAFIVAARDACVRLRAG